MGSVRFREVIKNGNLCIEEIHKIVVYRFKIDAVDDPDLYAAQPLWEWEKSDAGKFVMKNAVDQPVFHRNNNVQTFEIEYAVTAELEKKKLSEFYLRWGRNGSNTL